jgi:radical SAM superfamily enzyme YgiQ (UPF0313 family)
VNPKVITDAELALLRGVLREDKPVLVGLSVMSSMYLDTVLKVLGAVKSGFDAPVAAGGAFASMFPKLLLEKGCDFVLRADGENNLCAPADCVTSGGDFSGVPSLCYRSGGESVINPVGGLCENMDDYGLPSVNSENARYIENDVLKRGDPQLSSYSYEVIASRGCPFTCSYCCCPNLAKLYPPGTKRVRTRSVRSVIDELAAAKKVMKKLVMVHFYDEIFPNLPGWVDEFAAEYKKRVALPFVFWGHPKMIEADVLKKLVSVGLCEVIMGIQSGSEHIRRDVFHRYETNGDVEQSVETIRKSGVFWASYDFMLRHPFERLEDLKQTFELVKGFRGSYELQMHGLNFLPGTDIAVKAVEEGVVSAEDMQKIMWAPMCEQFGAYWQLENSRDSNSWYRLTYCLQFKSARRRAIRLAAAPDLEHGEIDGLYARCKKKQRLRYLYKKARIILKRVLL